MMGSCYMFVHTTLTIVQWHKIFFIRSNVRTFQVSCCMKLVDDTIQCLSYVSPNPQFYFISFWMLQLLF